VNRRQNVFGCFLDIRADPDEMNSSALTDVRTPKDRSLDDTGRGQLEHDDRKDIARAPRTTIVPVIGARGWPSQVGVNGVGTALTLSASSKVPVTSTANSLPESTVTVLAE
jgi:hypothetical protein